MAEPATTVPTKTPEHNSNTFAQGFKDGLAVGLGYLSVSFSFGILAVTRGLTWLEAVLISLTNITSAGQVAGLGIIATGGTIIAMILSQIVINMRYSLMGISLSQKTDSTMTPLMRVLLAYGITDEIFGVAITRTHDIGARYFFGLTILPVTGWVLGTLAGSLLGGIFPAIVTSALAIGIYGMFVSIVLPPAKRNPTIMFCSALSCLFSSLFFFVPFLSSHISSGIAVILSAVPAALVGVVIGGAAKSSSSVSSSPREKHPQRIKIYTILAAGAALIILASFVTTYIKSSEAVSESHPITLPIFATLLIAMAATTYLVRMIPFALFSRKLTNPRVKAFFDYIPYTVLSAMTFPAIFYATGSVISATAGFLVAFVLGYREKSLLTVAIGTCLAAFVANVVVSLI